MLWLIVALSLLFTTSVVLFFYCKTIKLRRKIHDLRVKHLLELERVKVDTLEGNIEFLEQEIQRLGADIHDDLIQRLSEHLLIIEKLMFVEDLTHAQAYSLQLRKHSRSIIKSVRVLSSNLLPGSINASSLNVALYDLCANLENPGVARVRFAYSGNEFSLPLQHQVHIVRIVQELVNNAINHSSAWHKNVKLIWMGSGLSVEVTNDGVLSERSIEKLKDFKSFRTLRMRMYSIEASLRIKHHDIRGLTATLVYPAKSAGEVFIE